RTSTSRCRPASPGCSPLLAAAPAAPGRRFARRSMALTGRAPRRQRSRGVAALELALSLTFLVPLLMGMLDFGYYFYIGTNAEEAARAGVREAVLASAGSACGTPAANLARANGQLPA